MSGTSLDGLDIALCHFNNRNGSWEYTIIEAETVDYSESEKNIFAEMYLCSGQRLIELDRTFGRFLGNQVNHFIEKYHCEVDFISSHGHTIFHQPDKGFTYQAGNGPDLSAITGLPVVCDFRSMDVALGGQGAPLVPIGDEMLFQNFSACLNLGGIANISFVKNSKRLAYDICPVNIPLNYLALFLGFKYDEGGMLASKGSVKKNMLEKLNSLEYYKKDYPKSLGKEWIDQYFFPLIKSTDISTNDLLATVCGHISFQINLSVKKLLEKKSNLDYTILVTGGGAFNLHLMDLLQKDAPKNVHYNIPDSKIIMFKEAIIFAYLGVLRLLNVPNALADVTGAKYNNVGGAFHGDFRNII